MDANFLKQFDNPNHAKVAALDNIFVTHRGMMKAINGITQCMSWSRESREPKGFVLTGLGGAGKTTICEFILKLYPPEEMILNGARIRTVPAFYTSVPSPCSIKSLASNMLEELGDPTPEKGTASGLTKRLCKLLVECETRVILLDELHNLLRTKERGQTKAEEVRDWLRSLTNKAKVMICLVGTPSCEAILQTGDGQMERRFAHRCQLRDLSCGTSTKEGELKGFLQELAGKYSSSLGLTGMPDFSSHELTAKMWAATSGRPAFVTLLLQTATRCALDARRTAVTISDLAQAFDSGITLDVAKTKTNPFEMLKYELNGAVMAKLKGKK